MDRPPDGPDGGPLPPALTVVVPVKDGAATIAEALTALLAQEGAPPFEVVVVDNRCTDGTLGVVERVAGDDPRVRVVPAHDRAGLPHARNVGVAAARAGFVAFCDADDVPGPGWVAAMAVALEDHPLVGSPLEWALLNDAPEVAGPGFQADDVGWFLGHPGVVGAGAGVQRALWDALGGNDESWVEGGEDFEFSYRAHRDRGVVPVLAPGATYHYRRRRGRGPIYRQARRNGRARAQLVAAFGRDGDRPPPGATVWAALRSWGWLVAHLPDLRDPVAGTRWVRVAGERVGRLQGSVRHRVVFP